MGCDIHILFQVYDITTKSWKLVKHDDDTYIAVEDHEIPLLNLDSSTILERDVDEEYERWSDAFSCFCFSVDRDYFLFAKIANVRNNENVLDYLEPRGIPKDLYAPLKDIVNDIDFHSHTWLSGEEIEALTLDGISQTWFCSFILARYYEKKMLYMITSEEIFYKSHLDPSHYASAVTGIIYDKREWDSFENDRKKSELKRKNVYIRVEYTSSLRSLGMEQIKRDTQQISHAFPGSQIRALISFDN